MRIFSALLVMLAVGCGSSHGADDGGTDAGADPSLVDTGTFPPPSGDPGTCVPAQFGGLECYMGPCPYDCCEGGVLETCYIQTGFECNVARATDCGGGTCVNPGERCPGPCDDPQPFYEDLDGDGVGAGDALVACDMPAGHAPVGGDCDDLDPSIGALVDDDLEDNDEWALATRLELARYEDLALCATTSGATGRDVDFYELPAVRGGQPRYLRIDIPSGISIAVTQLDGSREEVGYGDATGPDFLGAVLTDSAVLIRVDRFTSTTDRCSCVSYDLELSTTILW